MLLRIRDDAGLAAALRPGGIHSLLSALVAHAAAAGCEV